MKKEYEILKNPVFQLPIIYTEGSCEEAIEKRLNEYHDFIVKNKVESVSLHDSVNTFKNKILKMLEEYYLGHQNRSYELFKEAFKYETSANLPIKTVLPKEALYRARKNEGDEDYKKEEMFHIKYFLRSKVKTQRFSFPGLPCLYLGASAYVCWVELNRPSMEQFQITEIQQKSTNTELEVIDLGIHPLAFYKELEDREKGIKTGHEGISFSDYLRWWPIIAMCSVAVKNENDPFKPEYIFPQFVLQYFLENNIDNIVGIKYMSIKAGRISMRQYETDYRTYTNYVIPVKSINTTKEGFCTVLADQFEVKSNVSGKEHQMISGMIHDNRIKWNEIGGEREKDTHPLDETYIFTKNEIALQYGKSEYRKIEKILNGEIMKDLSVPIVELSVDNEELDIMQA